MKRFFLLNLLMLMTVALAAQPGGGGFGGGGFGGGGNRGGGGFGGGNRGGGGFGGGFGDYRGFNNQEVEDDGIEIPDTIYFRASEKLLERKGMELRYEGATRAINDLKLDTILGNNLFDTYYAARRQVTFGNDYLISGFGWLEFALINYLVAYLASGNTQWVFLGMAVGLTIPSQYYMCKGFIYRGIGNHRIQWVADTYNGLPAPEKLSVSLNPSLLLTPQSDLAFGATLSLHF